jgi:hypothetical protein
MSARTQGLWRRLRCRFGWHGASFKTEGDEAQLWGECIHCGKQVGHISRETLRRRADADALQYVASALFAKGEDKP